MRAAPVLLLLLLLLGGCSEPELLQPAQGPDGAPTVVADPDLEFDDVFVDEHMVEIGEMV